MKMDLSVGSAIKDTLDSHHHRIVSVSGGPDSMLLLYWSRIQAQSLDVVLHVWTGHHGMRHEADDDVALVRDWCQRRDLECMVEYYEDDIHTEEAMREWRYHRLSAMADAYSACILTGHHMDDRIETSLYKIRKGTGLLGSGGIAPARILYDQDTGSRCVLVRPLLYLTKAAIVCLCDEYEILYHIDMTNFTDAGGARNWIRHVMTQLMQEVRDGQSDVFYARWSRYFAHIDAWRKRMSDAYMIVDLPCSPYRSESISCQGVKLADGVQWTPSMIMIVLMRMGIYRHHRSSTMDVLMGFFVGTEGKRLDYGDVILWYMGGLIVVTRGGVFWEDIDDAFDQGGWCLMSRGDKIGHTSVTRYLQKQGVPLIWRSSALVYKNSDGVIVDCILPDEYVEWKSFLCR